MSILERINGHDDLTALKIEELETLCDEIREFLIEKVSHTGGHLASNLGTVELAVAIEKVYNTEKDRLVFDVGHQSYVHKLLTGRKDAFDNLRQFGGIAGFPKPSESQTDSFVAGHASNSVSIALGMARARTLLHQDYSVIALMGDGAATGGMAYESFNDLANSKEPVIVILNDNAMSIDRNVGGVATHLSRLRSSTKYLGMKRRYTDLMDRIPGGHTFFRITSRMKNWLKRILIPLTLFENMGLTYLGPVDGYALPELISLLEIAKDMKEPVLIHVITHKGHGYAPAENNPAKFHGIGRFDAKTGETLAAAKKTFSDSFGEAMVELARDDERICAITAAMTGGTGLIGFKENYPKRMFDVGIAEEHAVSMAGGLAKQGMIPVVAIYSTFLQRAFDQIQQDIAMLHLHAILAIDRSGLVGEDGETHHGIYDLGFLRQIPGMRVLCPVCMEEQKNMLSWAVHKYNGPVAIRYPRGSDRSCMDSSWDTDANHLLRCHRTGCDVTLVTYGTMLDNVMQAADILQKRGIQSTVLRLMQVAPLPVKEIVKNLSEQKNVFVIEEIAAHCGVYDELAAVLNRKVENCRVYGIDLGNEYVTHGALETLYKLYGLDADSVADYVQGALKNED